MPTGVMIYSACANNAQGSLTFHIVIDESVTVDNQQKLANTVTPFGNQICFYKVDSTPFRSFPALSERKIITQATYYRLFLTEILPQSVDKVIYLDGDIIVRQSLKELWSTDMTGFAVAAVTDKNEKQICYGSKEFRLGYPPYLGYFNAGVLLINLDYWRIHRVLNDFMEMIENRSDSIKSHDQDVLNYCFREKKRQLPFQYNVQDGFLYKTPKYDFGKYKHEILEARRNPVIIHYTGSKPWWTYNRHPHPWRSSFFKYRNQTVWKNDSLWEMRPWHERLKKHVALTLRRWEFIPELPPNGCEFTDIFPLD